MTLFGLHFLETFSEIFRKILKTCPMGGDSAHYIYLNLIMPKIQPINIVLHAASRQMEISFDDGENYFIPFELMRVYSPSAEVKGHGEGQEILQTGKRHVSIDKIEAVGYYAIQPFFSDGHHSGIFTWEYLYYLGSQQNMLWQQYEQRLLQAGASRDAPVPGTSDTPAATAQTGCGGLCRH